MISSEELVVDNFAGGGGASLGIEQAVARPIDIAINHDAEAIEMHRANHPQTRHLCEDVWQVDPVKVCAGRPVGLAWFSPDCKHFSKAKGGKPVSKRVRGLAWIVTRWAAAVRPRIIMLENVEEFQTWGPLLPTGMPNPRQVGRTFRAWWKKLERLGYVVEMRELRACDYGAPTIRKRLFIIARRDGEPIVWPKATHAAKANGLPAYRAAAECIDWDEECPSIFGRKKPLAPATMSRIARGLRRFVFESSHPFVIITANHSGAYRERSVEEPFRTVTSSRDAHGLVMPFLAGVGGRAGQSRPRGIDEPIATGTAKADAAIVTPFLTEYHGKTSPNGDRVRAADDPLAVQTTENRFGVVAPLMVPIDHQSAGDRGAKPADEPLATTTTENRHAAVLAFMEQANTGMTGHEAGKPLSTIVGRGTQQRLVVGHVEVANGGMGGSDPELPLGTVTAGPHHAAVASHLVKLHGSCKDGQPLDQPAPTIRAQGTHLGEVRAFLVKYYGTAVGQALDEPLHTATAKARLGLVTIQGEDYQIVDIGMRMLQPRELYRAQGFPDGYNIEPAYKGKRLTKTAQVRMCGNSVCPPIARALVAANV